MLSENNIRRDISSVKGDGYVISKVKKRILYTDATSLYGHSMSQMLLYDKIEMWHGHPDLHMNNFGEILNNSVDNDVGYFIEVDLESPNDIKEKPKTFPFAPENK